MTKDILIMTKRKILILFVRKVCNKDSVMIFLLLQYAPTDYLAVKRKPL